jgi:hypothetical protein
MEEDKESCIVECIRGLKGDMDITNWIRKMIGPFPTFLEAHEWMETIGVKDFDTLIIHNLVSPEKYCVSLC